MLVSSPNQLSIADESDREFPMMRRRKFITLLGGAAVSWPRVGRAQQMEKAPRIGYLGSSSPSLEPHFVEAFRQKLRELGHIEGENIAIEYRWAEGQDDRLPDLAAELVRLQPNVIVTTGTPGIIASDRLHSYRVCIERQSDHCGAGREPRPTGRERHRIHSRGG